LAGRWVLRGLVLAVSLAIGYGVARYLDPAIGRIMVVAFLASAWTVLVFLAGCLTYHRKYLGMSPPMSAAAEGALDRLVRDILGMAAPQPPQRPVQRPLPDGPRAPNHDGSKSWTP